MSDHEQDDIFLPQVLVDDVELQKKLVSEIIGVSEVSLDHSGSTTVTCDDSKTDSVSETSSDSSAAHASRELKSLLALSKEANLDTNISRKRKSLELRVKKHVLPISTPENRKSQRDIKQNRYPVTAESELESDVQQSDDSHNKMNINKLEHMKLLRKRKTSVSDTSLEGSKLNLSDASIGGSSDDTKKIRRKSLFASGEIVMFKPNKDVFCWRCHRDGVNIACETCVRSYHNKCLKQVIVDPKHWPCPECVTILKAESTQTRSEAMKGMTLEHLCSLLKFAVNRMMQCPGSEPFIHPVNDGDFPDYKKYIVQPMDLTLLERNIKDNLYGSTQAFEADAKWMLHNSIIFNSSQSKLTNLAKTIIKICKQEMAEIENCPSCYLNANTKKNTWFTEVCPKPHLLVWAKLRGFPYWPGKAMTVKDAMVDVRFFGAHDKAWVPEKECVLYCEKDPNGFKQKRTDIEECVKELSVYVENLKKIYGKFYYAPYRTPLDPANEIKQLQIFIPNYRPQPSPSPIKTKNAIENKSISSNDKVPTTPQYVEKKMLAKRQLSVDQSKNDGSMNMASDEIVGTKVLISAEEKDICNKAGDDEKKDRNGGDTDISKKDRRDSVDTDKENRNIKDSMEGYGTDDDTAPEINTAFRKKLRYKSDDDHNMDHDYDEEDTQLSSGVETDALGGRGNVKTKGQLKFIPHRSFDSTTQKTDEKSTTPEKTSRRNSDTSNKSDSSRLSNVSDKINHVDISENMEISLDNIGISISENDLQNVTTRKKLPPVQVDDIENTELSISPQSKLKISDKLMKRLTHSETEEIKRNLAKNEETLKPSTSSKPVLSPNAIEKIVRIENISNLPPTQLMEDVNQRSEERNSSDDEVLSNIVRKEKHRKVESEPPPNTDHGEYTKKLDISDEPPLKKLCHSDETNTESDGVFEQPSKVCSSIKECDDLKTSVDLKDNVEISIFEDDKCCSSDESVGKMDDTMENLDKASIINIIHSSLHPPKTDTAKSANQEKKTERKSAATIVQTPSITNSTTSSSKVDKPNLNESKKRKNVDSVNDETVIKMQRRDSWPIEKPKSSENVMKTVPKQTGNVSEISGNQQSVNTNIESKVEKKKEILTQKSTTESNKIVDTTIAKDKGKTMDDQKQTKKLPESKVIERSVSNTILLKSLQGNVAAALSKSATTAIKPTVVSKLNSTSPSKDSKQNSSTSVVLDSEQKTATATKDSKPNSSTSVVADSKQKTTTGTKNSKPNSSASVIVDSKQKTPTAPKDSKQNSFTSIVVDSKQKTATAAKDSKHNSSTSVIVDTKQKTSIVAEDSKKNSSTLAVISMKTTITNSAPAEKSNGIPQTKPATVPPITSTSSPSKPSTSSSQLTNNDSCSNKSATDNASSSIKKQPQILQASSTSQKRSSPESSASSVEEVVTDEIKSEPDSENDTEEVEEEEVIKENLEAKKRYLSALNILEKKSGDEVEKAKPNEIRTRSKTEEKRERFKAAAAQLEVDNFSNISDSFSSSHTEPSNVKKVMDSRKSGGSSSTNSNAIRPEGEIFVKSFAKIMTKQRARKSFPSPNYAKPVQTKSTLTKLQLPTTSTLTTTTVSTLTPTSIKVTTAVISTSNNLANQQKTPKPLATLAGATTTVTTSVTPNGYILLQQPILSQQPTSEMVLMPTSSITNVPILPMTQCVVASTSSVAKANPILSRQLPPLISTTTATTTTKLLGLPPPNLSNSQNYIPQNEDRVVGSPTQAKSIQPKPLTSLTIVNNKIVASTTGNNTTSSLTTNSSTTVPSASIFLPVNSIINAGTTTSFATAIVTSMEGVQAPITTTSSSSITTQLIVTPSSSNPTPMETNDSAESLQNSIVTPQIPHGSHDDELTLLNSLVTGGNVNRSVAELFRRPPPRLQKRPPSVLSVVSSEVTPSSVGPVTARINSVAHRFGDYFRGMLIETLDDLSKSQCAEATITNLQLEIEDLKNKHTIELAQIEKNITTVLKDIQKSVAEDRERVIEETRALCEAETIKRVDEAKSKQWCVSCGKEAQFYCCWNTSYCDYPCQQKHWPQHMSKCSQNVNGGTTNSGGNIVGGAPIMRPPAPGQQLILRPANPPPKGRIFTKPLQKVYMNRHLGPGKTMKVQTQTGAQLTVMETTPGNFQVVTPLPVRTNQPFTTTLKSTPSLMSVSTTFLTTPPKVAAQSASSGTSSNNNGNKTKGRHSLPVTATSSSSSTTNNKAVDDDSD